MGNPHGGEAAKAQLRGSAMRLVVLLGLVSLSADIIYEGARSISGPFLAQLGASAVVVGVVAGSGELAGFALRIVAGRLSDRTGAYWGFTIAGYALTVVAVPALAFAVGWPVAAMLLVLERVGKGVRTPARDAILADAGRVGGTGRAFGLHEAIDQIGAVAGPLLLVPTLILGATYRHGFLLLGFAGIPVLAFLVLARRQHGRLPQDTHASGPRLGKGFPKKFWRYAAAAAVVGAGFADFALVAYHFERASVVAPAWIPAYYAAAMAVDAASAIALGSLYDRHGIAVIAPLMAVAAMAPALLFLGSWWVAFLGALLWGLGMGALESVVRAGVADLAPEGRVATAFGTFHLIFGIAWFLGSAALGILYEVSIVLVVTLAVTLTLTGAGFFVWTARMRGPQGGVNHAGS